MRSVRGMKDIYGEGFDYYSHVLEHGMRVAECFNYDEVLTPLLEHSDVFYRTLGEMSDIITKETYTFDARDGASLTLRPEFTASVARFIISNGLQQSIPLKLFTHGALFRYERPQLGRYRQFHQLDYEYIGVRDPMCDVEVILTARFLLEGLGILENAHLIINTIGTATERAQYVIALREHMKQYIGALSDDSKLRLTKNPLRILDSKDEGDKEIISSAPKLYDYLSTSSREYFESVLSALDDLSIPYEVNHNLVRGLDYYSDTVFEFITDDLGAQSAIASGGRYDDLIANMGGNSLPAIGFAAGIERIQDLLMQRKSSVHHPSPVASVVFIGGTEVMRCCFDIANSLRAANLRIHMEYSGNLSKQLKKAAKKGSMFAVLVGEDEMAAKKAKVRDMSSGEELSVPFPDLVAFFSEKRG